MDPPATPPAAHVDPARRVTGVCFVFFAYDVGLSIDLDAAAHAARELTARTTLKHRRRAPGHFMFQPPPLRLTQPAEAIALTGFETGAAVDCTLYDFGAVSVGYRIEIDADIGDLTRLSGELYDNAALHADARRRAETLVRRAGPAIHRAALGDAVEDYTIFCLSAPRGVPPAKFIDDNAQTVAQILRAESELLAEEQVRDALSARLSYGEWDVTLLDWNGALIFDDDTDDVINVLEYLNVELLEMRVLDDRLDRTLEETVAGLHRHRFRALLPLAGTGAFLRRLAALQADGTLLFEGVNNALKLLGDQWLARVYRRAAERLRLGEWDTNVLRKLQTIESIHSKASDSQASLRMELLEWIIILLIAVEVANTFFPGWFGAGH